MADFMDFVSPAITIVSRLVEAGGKQKRLYCDHCSGFTLHVSVRHAELERLLGERQRFIATASEFNPLDPLMNGRFYVCEVCGTPRLHGGIWSESLNRETREGRIDRRLW